MKTGGPNGATPSSRTLPPASSPAMMRPRSDVSPVRPDSPSSAVKVVRPVQCAVAAANSSTASGAADDEPDGRGGRRVAHCALASARRMARNSGRRDGTATGELPAAARILDLLVERRAVDRFEVALERALPRAAGFGPLPLPGERIAVVILDDGVGRQRLGRLRERRDGGVDLALPEERPAEAVEVRGVVGLDGERPLDE